MASTAAQAVARAVEGDHLPLATRAADHHDLVVGVGQADHLDLGRRTGPTRRTAPGRRATAAADPASRLRAAAAPPSAALVQCSTRAGRPVEGRIQLATSPAATTRSAAKRAPSQATPLSRSRPEPSSQPDRRHDPDPHHDHVGRQPGAVGEARRSPGRGRRGRTRGGRRSTPHRQVHAVGQVQVGAHLPHLVAQHPGQRRVVRLEQRHPGAEPLAGGGHLGADEPGADHHHTGRRPRPPPGRPGCPGSRRGCAASTRRASPRCPAAAGWRPRWPRPGRRRPARCRRRAPRCGPRRRGRWPDGRAGTRGRVASRASGVWWWIRSTSHLPDSSCLDSGGRS